jgi:hypothetical protein
MSPPVLEQDARARWPGGVQVQRALTESRTKSRPRPLYQSRGVPELPGHRLEQPLDNRLLRQVLVEAGLLRPARSSRVPLPLRAISRILAWPLSAPMARASW